MRKPVTRAELSSWRAKLFYGFGSIAYGIKDFGFGTLLLFYYNQVLGLPAAEVSLAILVVLWVDAFADPTVGQISDNLRTRWGRRHPFMYASAIPVAVAYFFLWSPPHGLSHAGLIAYLIVMAILVRTFITMYEIPSSAMVPEMTDDYDQRTTFISLRYVFGVAGAVLINAATFAFLLHGDKTHPDGRLNPAGYPLFAAVSAVVMLISILVSARGTHRYIPMFSAPQQRRAGVGTLIREMITTLMHRQFLLLLIAAIFGTMAIGLGAALLVYINTYFWAFTTKQLAIIAFAGAPAVIVPPLLAWPLSRLMGKKPAAIVFYGLCVTLAVLPISLRLLGLFPPNGTPLLFWLVFGERALSTVFGIGCLILFGSMTADVVEDSAIRTGRRSEGLFFSAVAFINKLLSGAGTFLAGILLAAAQFPENANPATLDPAIPTRLIELYLPTMVFFYGMGMIVLSRYKIDRATHEENVRLLSETEAQMAVAVVAAPPAQ